MGKLSRVDMKIFGSSGGTTEFGQFGSDAAGAALTTKDLATIQALSEYLEGWYSATSSGSEPPAIQDMNGLFLLITSQLRYFMQMGMPEWLAAQDYYIGSWVQVAGVLYMSKTGTDGSPNTGHNPVSDSTNWTQVNLDMLADGTTYHRVAAAKADGLNGLAYTPNFRGPGELVESCLNATALASRRLIALTGQVITIASYPELCTAVYCGDANNPTAPAFYKTSDAGGSTRSTSGAYMVFPDARGLMIVGIGQNTKIFPANHPTSVYDGGSAIGAMLTELMQGHYHAPYGSATQIISGATSGQTLGSTSTGSVWFVAPSTGGPITDGTNGTPRTGAYTHGPNLAAQICITY